MRSKKVAGNNAEVDARKTRADAPSRRQFRPEPEKHRDPVVGHFNGLGPALIEIYEADAEHRIKTDLLDQVVSVIRRKKSSDERAREIAILMRGWRQMHRS